MPDWVSSIQGIREVLNSAGTALTRRKQIQFNAGLTAVDNGSRTVVSGDGPTLVAQSGVTAAISAATRGVGLTVDGTALATRARPRQWHISDHMMGGLAVSGQIGREGWAFFASNSGSVARSSGSGTLSATNKYTITTDANANDYAAMGLATAVNSNVCVLSEIEILQFAIEIPTALSNRRVSVGFHDDLSADPQTDAASLALVYDSSVGANWLVGARDASTGTYSSTGVAASLTGVLVTLYNTGSSWQFYLDNTLVGTVSSNLPSGFVTFGPRIETLTTAAVGLRVGYIGVNGAPTGVYDNDTFLEA